MNIRALKRSFARYKKRLSRPENWLIAACVVILVGMTTASFGDGKTLDAAAYKPLLTTIAKGESGGNYNAYFGSPGNTSVRFTDMTIAEVLRWQSEYVSQGSISSAVGKYQIIQPTLIDITSELHISHEAVFNEALQDRLAIALIERRGSLAYVNNQLTREEFAENLAKEWAAFPKMSGENPAESYYADDGINQATISTDEAQSALDSLENSAKNDD